MAMTAADKIRNSIIDKLLTISDSEYLSALLSLIEKSDVDTEAVKLSETQILMLNMSEEDLKNGRTISQKDLDEEDLKWLSEL